MYRIVSAICSLVFALFLVGCATVTPSGVNILVAVTNAFTYAQVGKPAITLQATTTYDGSHKGVKWALTAANIACSPECGTLAPSPSPSFSAVYTPPTNTPTNQQATITAFSVADGHQDYAFTFSIVPPASVQITNKFTSILNGSSPVQVNATVTNDPSNSGVTWTLTTGSGGASCSPACGTLTPAAAPSLSATYAPPPTYPGGANANPTITATSVANTAASDSFAFNVLSSASLVKGNYTILLRGYDSIAPPNGPLPMSLSGVITADGNGNITNAEFDVNDDGGITTIAAGQSGTYNVQVTSTGVTQVQFEISSFKFSGSNIDLQFRCFLSADGKRGRIVELDGENFTNAGIVELQDTSAISAPPTGKFSFGVDSDAPFGGRTIAAGQLVLASSGVTGGLIDQSVNAGTNPTFIAQPISPDTLTSPDGLGRGTFTVTVQAQSVQYAYYIVDSSHFDLIEIDRGTVFGTVFAGIARSQNNLTAASVNGVSVVQLTGFDEPTGTSNVLPVVLVGLLTVTAGNSYNLVFDINDLGNSLTQHGSNGSVTFDPATGRATLSAPDGFNGNFVNAAAWYLYDSSAGFFVEEDISTTGLPPDQSVTNRALSGTTLLQTGAPFKAADLSGNFIAGSGASSSPQIPSGDFTFNFVPPASGGATGAGDYTAVGDVTSSQQGNIPNVSFSGKYRIINAAQGYGGIQFPSPLFGDFTQISGTNYSATFYMIAPNHFVSVGTQFGIISGVIFADPD
jgi:hypothetical protein